MKLRSSARSTQRERHEEDVLALVEHAKARAFVRIRLEANELDLVSEYVPPLVEPPARPNVDDSDSAIEHIEERREMLDGRDLFPLSRSVFELGFLKA
jgi:hypothetical protein